MLQVKERQGCKSKITEAGEGQLYKELEEQKENKLNMEGETMDWELLPKPVIDVKTNKQ